MDPYSARILLVLLVVTLCGCEFRPTNVENNSLDPDVRLFAEKKQMAIDLRNPINANPDICRTDFTNFIDMRDIGELSSQAALQTLEEDRLDWQRVAEAQSGVATPSVDSLAAFQVVDAVEQIQTSNALFEIQDYRRPHYQQFEISSVNARNARLVVNTLGKVAMVGASQQPQLLLQHPVVLTYFFTRESNGWNCISVEPSFNPYRKNQRWQDELARCAQIYRWQSRIDYCRAEVNARFERPASASSLTPETPSGPEPPKSW